MMRSGYRAFMIACAAALALMVFSVGTLACTSIALPPGSTIDGSSFATHNADSGATPYEMHKVPAAEYAPGTMYELLTIPQMSNGLQLYKVALQPTGQFVEQAEKTYGYIKSSIFGYVNEMGVGIGETTISGRRELSNQNGYLDITHLSMFAMERGATAREAIQVMGSLAEKYGYSDGGEELTVIDGKEAWIFEIIGPGPLWQVGDKEPGAFWVAQRVKDGYVSASANTPAIRQIEWDNKDEFMYSPGIMEYAIANGWYDPSKGEPFEWRLHFVKGSAPSNRRIWRVFSLLNPDLAPTLDENNLPFQVPVKYKVSAQQVLEIHRDHYDGTEFDLHKGIGAGPWGNPRRYYGTVKADGKSYSFQRIISVRNCEYLTLVQCRENVDPALKGLLWFSPVCPDAAWMLPIYASVTALNPTYREEAGDHFDFSRKSIRWAVGSLSTYMNLKYTPMYADMCKFRDKYEGAAFRNQKAVETAAVEILKQDRDAGIRFLTDYSWKLADSFREAIWETVDYLMWKYDMGFVTENGKVNGKGYPAEWIDMMFKYDFGSSDVRGWSNYVAPTK